MGDRYPESRAEALIRQAQGVRVFIFRPIPAPEPVPLHRIRLTDFLSSPAASPEMEVSVTAAIADHNYIDNRIPYNPVARLMREAGYRDLLDKAVECRIPGFVIAWHGHCQENPLVAVFDAETGELAGGLEHKNVFVRPPYRGMGLGSEILIVAFENAIRHPIEMNRDNTLTAAGRANRVAAHRIAVERALEDGLEVPPEVLEDYPHLAGAGMALA